jgi:prepilin-type N-terminal cleavage/methylation domain-containing protein
MVGFRKAHANGGFSLLELLVVIAILGILMRIAWLPFREMIANQRLRSVTSDLVADLALARVEAIKRSSRVGVARTTASLGGWVAGLRRREPRWEMPDWHQWRGVRRSGGRSRSGFSPGPQHDSQGLQRRRNVHSPDLWCGRHGACIRRRSPPVGGYPAHHGKLNFRLSWRPGASTRVQSDRPGHGRFDGCGPLPLRPRE